MKPTPVYRLALALGALLLTQLAAGCRAAATPPSGGQDLFYLSWDGQDVVQLFRLDLEGGEPVQLTESAGGVTSFALSAGGARIGYSAGDGAGGSQVRLIGAGGSGERQLAACPRAICSGLVWHPDGRRLVYERRAYRGDGTLSGEPALYWLDTDTGETVPLFAGGQGISQAASFSPDGAWISYAGSADEGIIAYNLESGEEVRFESEMGTPAAWSPDSGRLIIRDHYLVSVHGDEGDDHASHSHDFALGIYLFTADIAAGTSEPISGEAQVDDSAPAWSPDGSVIVFTRKLPRTQTGRQLWLINPDGSGARPLTDDLSVHHGAPSWSPDGSQIAFQKVAALRPEERPQIWVYDLAADEMGMAAAAGFMPQFVRPTASPSP